MSAAEQYQAEPTRGLDELHLLLRRLDRQSWWLWATAVGIMLLLIGALFSFTFPGLWGEGSPVWAELDIAVRGLLGLVLLFAAFVVYQQVLITRLRRELAGELARASALQTRAELFEKLAGIDPLTDLYNRRFATAHLGTELARAERFAYPVTALMLDLNGFKQINDSYGHAAGDLALSEFARHLKRSFRSSDLCVRMGGDEFLVLLPECPEEQVPRVLTHLRGMEVEFQGEKIPISFAAGWAQHQRGEDAEQLLARADQALYADKHTRNTEKQVRAAEEKMAQAHKMETMGQMAGGVAHDFNNLLTAIMGHTELVLESLPADDPIRDKVCEIARAADRAGGLVRQLLAFSHTRALQLHALNLNAAVLDLESTMRALLESPIELRIETGRDLGTMRAGPTQLEQVILNLVVNARDAMPQGGRLTIRTLNARLDEAFVSGRPGARPGDYVALEVSDTGTGMDAETRKHIFDPFFTTKPDGKGTGLGLAIVYGVAKQTGGYIDVESELGRGTKFTVYFPRMTSAAAGPAPVTLGRAASAA